MSGTDCQASLATGPQYVKSKCAKHFLVHYSEAFVLCNKPQENMDLREDWNRPKALPWWGLTILKLTLS